MRQRLLLGNWKMNGSLETIRTWCAALRVKKAWLGSSLQGLQVGVMPPFPYLERMVRELGAMGWRAGAQDLSSHDNGAFSGEVSGRMLAELGCVWVLVGHSERRILHGETDAIVTAELAAALRANLTPVLCVGETLAERKAGLTDHILERQLGAVLTPNGAASLAHMVIAYEPIWAIGTGRTATPSEAQEVHAFLRRLISAAVGELAEQMSILYGGSVKAENATKLFAMSDIDGGLVGRASLDANEFAAIIQATGKA